MPDVARYMEKCVTAEYVIARRDCSNIITLFIYVDKKAIVYYTI